MTYLLDTNVASETSLPAPSTRVAQWLQSLSVTETFLSVVTLTEVRRGVELANDESRKRRLALWLSSLKQAFGGRILPIDEDVAELCGSIEAKCQRSGRRAERFDALIAATAEVHGLTVATRNTKDFEIWGGPVFNPWTDT